MFKNTLTSIFIITLIGIMPLSFSSESAAAEAQEKKKRPTQLVGPSVGKKVARAFDLYSVDDIAGALVILLDIDASKDYDKAYVARFIAVMYAQKGEAIKSIQYLKQAVAPDILNEGDHGQALKLLGDLQMQEKQYKEALVNYTAWMDFTGQSDGNTWVKIGQIYSELKQLDKVIVPADKAIAAFGDKHNQNPYVLKIQSYYERKMFNEAVDVLETVLQVFPENKTWWTQLGMFYLLIEDYERGLAVLDLSYKQGFLDKESQIKTLASLYSSNQIPVKAARILEKHIDSGLVKRDDKNLSSLANAWHAAQHIDKAAKYYGEVAKMTNDAKHFRKQGMLLKQDEQFKAAVTALNKALELGASGEGRIQMSIAESHFYLEQYKKAYAAIQKAMKDPKVRRAAKGWVSFIKDTAQRKGKSI